MVARVKYSVSVVGGGGGGQRGVSLYDLRKPSFCGPWEKLLLINIIAIIYLSFIDSLHSIYSYSNQILERNSSNLVAHVVAIHIRVHRILKKKREGRIKHPLKMIFNTFSNIRL